ncbi:MAG: site-2 protease family protein [Desulfobacteraceae bacterium]|nr:site-2 protease family protein [Desulfobacteraceae bacterium]
MVSHSLIKIPFVLDFSNLQFDTTVIFIVSILLAITVNAEAQAFMATVLGDAPPRPKDRFHFNPLFHMDLSGLLCFAVAGFGWPRQPEIEADNFKRPGLGLILVKFAGPAANLMLASITGSILWLMGHWGLEDQVFSILLAVNLMVFTASFLPIPPLAGATLVSFLFPRRFKSAPPVIRLAKGLPYLFVAALLVIRENEWNLLNAWLYPAVTAMFDFISG